MTGIWDHRLQWGIYLPCSEQLASGRKGPMVKGHVLQKQGIFTTKIQRFETALSSLVCPQIVDRKFAKKLYFYFTYMIN